MYHHGTIRKYTAALISFFNDVEVQNKNSSGTTITKNVPLVYSSREKSKILDNKTTEQLLSGNYNVLPRSSLALAGMVKSPQRAANKNHKIGNVKTENSIQYMYNSVPYEFTYELVYQCRGMNEASQIIEQIAPVFNPILNIDIFDGDNLNEPTRIPVKLEGIDINTDEYDELTSNIFLLTFTLSIQGNLYQPIKSQERIKEFKIRMNEYDNDNYYTKKSILGWDVNESGELQNGTIVTIPDVYTYPPVITSINANTTIVGDNNFVVIFEDKDNPIEELTFNWEILSGDGSITFDNDKAIVTANSIGTIDIQVTITDVYGNYATYSELFAFA